MTTSSGSASALEFRCRRKALGLSREELAARLGVRNATVAKWEAGRAPIPEGVGAELSALEDRLDAQTSAYLRAAEDAQRIELDQDEVESGVHRVAAARALAALRREGVVVGIVAAPSQV